jgi:hypothetical protein
MWGASPDEAHPGLHLKLLYVLHRIAAAAVMVDDFGRKHTTLTKTIFS